MAKKAAKEEKVVRVTLVKSAIGYDITRKRTLRALGFGACCKR